MMNATQMSAAIRAKKKKMEAEKEAVKLSGIPEDATEIDINKQHEATDRMDENEPKDHDEEPSLDEQHAATVEAQPHEEKAPDPHEVNEPGEIDEEKEMKKARIRASFLKAMSA